MRVWDGMHGRALAQPFPQPPLCFSLSLPLPHLKSAMLAAVMPHLKVGAWVKCRGVWGGSCVSALPSRQRGGGVRARAPHPAPPLSLSPLPLPLTQKWIVCGPAGWFQKARRRLVRVAGAWDDMRGWRPRRGAETGRKGGGRRARWVEREGTGECVSSV